MTRKRRFPFRFEFWLDLNDDTENTLADYIAELKAARTFVTTVRDGLRLIRDLRSGEINVLLELFPMVAAKLQKPTPQASNDDIKREIAALQELLLSQNSNAPLVAAPRALNAPSSFALPTLDDDDMDTIVLSKDTNTDSALNFLNSMMNLQQ